MTIRSYSKMLTKNQVKIMQIFVSHMTELFTIREISRLLKKDFSLVHRTIQPLIKNALIKQTKERYLTLDYKENHQELAYIEHLRTKEFLSRPMNKTLAMFADEVIKKFPKGYFVLLVFGSALNNRNPRDIDLLMIIDKTEDIEPAERALYNISRKYTLKFHTVVISFESVYEMLGTRDQKNVMNELLNKHLVLYGAELFYKLVKEGRK